MTDDNAPASDPDDLDFTKDERVAEIDEGRYVVSTDGRPNVGRSTSARTEPDREGETQPDDSPFTTPTEPKSAAEREPTASDGPEPASRTRNAGSGEDARGGGGAGSGAGPASSAGTAAGGGAGNDAVDAGAVSRWLSTSFENDGFQYGFDATLHAEGDTSRHRMVSNDVTATFDTLVSWFAMNAGREAPPAEALGLLLVAADSPVQFPVGTLKRYVAQKGLSPDDSIGDLIREIEADGGLRIDD